MTLRDRLRAMNAAGTRQSTSRGEGPSAAHLPAAEDSRALFTAIPNARIAVTPFGPVVSIETAYPLAGARGKVPLRTAQNAPSTGWQRLLHADARARSFSIHEAVFIDTETTGLERGAGTYAFLVGIGRIRGDEFRVRQLFMRDYHEEAALMHELIGELQGATGVVTFNGKTFDWPLLQTRAVLNRMELPDLIHLDVLHPARRLWSGVTQSCRLVQLEQEVLGTGRIGDVPGELIPSLFFQYLQTGDIAPLLPVFEHNRLDIVTTFALAGYLAQGAAEPLTAAPAGAPLPGSDLYAFGRLFAEQGDLQLAIDSLEEARRRDLPPRLLWPCTDLLASLYKRAGDYERALPLWREMADAGALVPQPHVELAKYYEHRRKEFHTAREWTLRAIDAMRQRWLLSGLGRAREGSLIRRELAELYHRLERLDNRLARAQSEAAEPYYPA